MAWVCKSCGILWCVTRTLKKFNRNDVSNRTCPDCLRVGKGGE